MNSLGTFKTQTTYQNDFISHQIHKYTEKKERLKKYSDKLKPIKQPPEYDLETLSQFRQNVYVPFNLFFRPKEVTRTNPHETIKKIQMEEKIFEEKLAVRKIRPRVYLEPQIAFDDIPENVMYGKNGLSDYIYGSDWKDSIHNAVKHSPLTKRSKLSEENEQLESDNKFEENVLLDKSMEGLRFIGSSGIPAIDSRFQKYATDWEKQRKKYFVDKTKLFWEKNQNIGLCKLCDPQPQNKVVRDEDKKEIDSCVNDNELRFSYTVLNPAYTGYLPKCPLGVSYRKKLFKIGDPYVTTSMQVEGVYRKD